MPEGLRAVLPAAYKAWPTRLVTQTCSHAPDRVFRIAMTLAPPSAGACGTGLPSLTAEPIAGRGAKGGRREPWPGRSGCRQCPRSGSPGGRWASALDHPAGRTRQAAMPGTPRQSRPQRPRLPGAGRCGCPERPSPSSGITLSDEGRQEGRKRTRRLALIRSGAQIGSIWQAKISCGVSAAATRNPDGRDPRSFIQNKYCQRTGPTSGPSSGLYRP